MHDHTTLLKLLLWITFVLALFLSNGAEDDPTVRCLTNTPRVTQSRVGKAKYKVEVVNKCGTCPVIDIHVKCGRFPQSKVNPKVLKVLKFDDCVVNSGLPLPPLQAFSFNYSNPTLFPLSPLSWFFQCELSL